MGTDLYRAEAIALQRQMDDLPRMMTVVDGMMRIVSACLVAALLIAVCLAGIVHVPVTLDVSGVTVDSSGTLLRPANAVAAGIVERVFVKTGDAVLKDQPILRLSIPAMNNAIAKAKQELADTLADDRRTSVLDAHDEKSETDSRDMKAAGFDADIARMERRLQWLRQQEAAEASLKAQGLTTDERLLTARIATQDLLDQIDKAKTDRTGLFAQLLESSDRRARDRLVRQQTIDDKQAALAALTADREAQSVIRSPAAGVVAELATDVGQAVTTGAVVFNILPVGQAAGAVEAIVYLPLADGKQVKPNDSVLLLPASLPEDVRDRVKGHVLHVSRTPATQSAVREQLGSDDLFRLMTKDGPIFAVTIALDTGPSGALAWASGHAPQGFVLERGTPVTGAVTIERTALLSLFLPALRRLIDPSADRFPWGRS